MKTYTIKETKELPQSELEMTVEISWKDLESARAKALKVAIAQSEIQGFRKGHAPEKMVVESMGEMRLLEHAAQDVIDHAYMNILEDKKLQTLGSPQVTVSKIAIGSPLEFKLRMALLPKVKLPNYKKIATEVNSKEEKIEAVTEKEIDTYIEEVRKGYARQNHSYKEGHSHDEHNDEDLELPELTDDFAQKLGAFENILDLKTKVKEFLTQGKAQKAGQKKRLETIDAVITKTELELPQVLVTSELEKMLGQFKDDVTRMGVKMEDYLTHIKKTEDDLRKEWTPDAEKKAKINIVLAEIALAEKLTADAKEVETQAGIILKQHKDADPIRVKMYVEHLLINEAVFKLLEAQK